MFEGIKKPVVVKYAGPFGDASGYGEANRNAIMALHAAGVDVTTERVSYLGVEAEHGETYELAARLEGRPIKYDIKIVHVPSDGYLKFLEPTKYHIGHLFWETDSLSKTWVWNCNLMDEIWTGGNIHKEHFRKAGVKVPIFVYPQAINVDVPVQRPFTIKEHQGFLFYSIFEWIERKNPRALLRAYWREFEGEENVSLLLKVYRFNSGKEGETKIRTDVQEWKQELKLRHFPRIFLYTKMVSRADVVRLHYTGDCFVSAHRGEGWGVPQVESAVVGNPIISTNIGGCHEWFEDNKNAFLVKWEKESVFNMDFAPWYEKNQHWAAIDDRDLRARMRFVFEHPDEARKVGSMGQTMVRDKFNYMVVGGLMRNRLEDIRRLIK